MTQLVFDKEKVQKAERDFSNIDPNLMQNPMIISSAKLYTQFLPLSEMVLKGFISFSMRDYQIKNKKDLSNFSDWDPDFQAKALWEISDILKGYLTNILRKSDQKLLLEDTIKKVMEVALKHFQL